jgi:hypothetical protein
MNVIFHRLFCQIQPRSDLLVGEPFPQQRHQFVFSPAQHSACIFGGFAMLRHVTEQSHGESPGTQRRSLGNPADRGPYLDVRSTL